MIITSIIKSVTRVFRRPAFPSLAAIVLAFGVGCSSAALSLVYQAVLRPLPIPASESMVTLHLSGDLPGSSSSDSFESVFSYPMYRALRSASSPTLDGLIARTSAKILVGAEKDAYTKTRVEFVSGNVFSVMSQVPYKGRLIALADERLGSQPVAVISYGYWRAHYRGQDPVGKQIFIGATSVTIIGVGPELFRGVVTGFSPSVYLPITSFSTAVPDFSGFRDPKTQWLNILGRLPHNAQKLEAQSFIQRFFHSEYVSEMQQLGVSGSSLGGVSVNLEDGSRGINRIGHDWHASLYIVIYTSVALLFTAALSLTKLAVLYVTRERHSFAVRVALGSPRSAIVQEILVLAAIIGVAGWLGSIAIQAGTIFYAVRLQTSDLLGGWITADPNLHILAASLILALAVSFGAFLGPVLSFVRSRSIPLQQSLGRATRTIHEIRLSRTLLMVQIAVSLVLTMTATLLERSNLNLLRKNLGFKPDHLVAFTVDSEFRHYSDRQSGAAFRTIQQRLASSAQVSAVSCAQFAPFDRSGASSQIGVEGYTPSTGEHTDTLFNVICPDYFRTLGVHLIRGDEMTFDTPGVKDTVVVNESFTKRYFVGRNPIGRHLIRGQNQYRIIGVAADTTTSQLQDDPMPTFYLPLVDPVTQTATAGRAVFLLRTQLELRGLRGMIGNAVREVDSSLPISEYGSIDRAIKESVREEQALIILSVYVAILAVILSALGLYSVTAYAVALSSREYAIRMALGAGRHQIAGVIIKTAILPVTVGLTLGVGISLAIASYLRANLYGIAPTDTTSFGLSVGLILTISLVSIAGPLFRGTRADMTTLMRTQ